VREIGFLGRKKQQELTVWCQKFPRFLRPSQAPFCLLKVERLHLWRSALAHGADAIWRLDDESRMEKSVHANA
jgi:hypothetical protein